LCNIKLADIDFPILNAKEWIGYIAGRNRGLIIINPPASDAIYGIDNLKQEELLHL
jgi:hypothetical protein